LIQIYQIIIPKSVQMEKNSPRDIVNIQEVLLKKITEIDEQKKKMEMASSKLMRLRELIQKHVSLSEA